MKKIYILFGVSVIIGCGLLSFFVAHKNNISQNVAEEHSAIVIGDVRMEVDIANTQAKRSQGLSGRPSLGDNEGMLFLFDTPGPYGFWMKDMNFPIDIIWIDSNKRIVGVKENATPESYPSVFYPPTDISYVLEAPAGFFERQNLKVGEMFFSS